MSDLVPVTVLVPAGELKGLYAYLGGVSVAAIAVGAASPAPVQGNVSSTPSGSSSGPTQTVGSASPADNGERDAAGVLWDENKHASTKTKVGSGLWRMKVGVKRPDGEGEEAIPGNGTGTNAATPSSTAAAPTAQAASGAVTGEEDDEFAAFRAAATPPAARTWADGDLSKLCNQAAVKAGTPEKVKEIIAKYVPEGQQQHSRVIPVELRENFAKEIEAAFGIVYEG